MDSAIPGILNSILDFTAIFVKQPALLPRSSAKPLYAARVGEKWKADMYELHSKNLGKNFCGLVMEPGGAMGSGLQGVIRAACEHLPPVHGASWSAPTAKHYHVQAISVAFWRRKQKAKRG